MVIIFTSWTLACLSMAENIDEDSSLAGQSLHERGRVWCRAYTRVVPALMQHLWIHYEDLAPDWPVCTLGIAPTN